MNCLDTYALMEIHNGNPYFSFLLNEPFVITDLTMAEFYAVLLREHDKKIADHWFNKLVFYCKPVELETLVAAARFRHENKKKRVSFFDAVGYVYSIEKKYFFVTGDKEFKGLKSVKFVK